MTKQTKPEFTNIRLTVADKKKLLEVAHETHAAKLTIASLLVSKGLRDAPELDTPEFWEWWSELGSPF